MINPFADINWKPDSHELRKFGRTVFFGLLLISMAVLFSKFHYLKSQPLNALCIPLILSGAGLVILFSSYFIRHLALSIYYLWFIAGASLGMIISNLALALFFYCILTPVALAFKHLFGRDILGLRKRDYQKSNWENISENKPLKRYFKQY